MAKMHMVLQGKGGVGKSFIAAMLAQYMAARGHEPLCVDTDPVNATFHGYQALKVHRIEIMENDEINSRHFDALVELVASSRERRHYRQWREFLRALVPLPHHQPGARAAAGNGS